MPRRGDQIKPTPKENLKRIGGPSDETGQMEFWVSDVLQLCEDDDEWGFRLYANKTQHIATFIYPGLGAAQGAYKMLPVLLLDCTFIDNDLMVESKS